MLYLPPEGDGEALRAARRIAHFMIGGEII